MDGAYRTVRETGCGNSCTRPCIRPLFHPSNHPSILHSSIDSFLPFHYSFILYIAILTQANFCCHCLIAQDHRAHLHKNTGLDSREKMAINQCRDPVGRVETVAGHTVAPPRSPLYLIQPYSPPFVYKQFRYWMDGVLTGELFLSCMMQCQLRSARTGTTTPYHGTWQYCRQITAINAYCDFDGRQDEANFKWAFFRGTEGVDYMGPRNQCRPNCGVGA